MHLNISYNGGLIMTKAQRGWVLVGIAFAVLMLFAPFKVVNAILAMFIGVAISITIIVTAAHWFEQGNFKDFKFKQFWSWF
jgi:ABC-type nickel/cobalt efflux system permease component RcnA